MTRPNGHNRASTATIDCLSCGAAVRASEARAHQCDHAAVVAWTNARGEVERAIATAVRRKVGQLVERLQREHPEREEAIARVLEGRASELRRQLEERRLAARRAGR